MEKTYFRHEYKYIINACDYEIVKGRLSRVMAQDVHTDGSGKYTIMNIYFDSPGDAALFQKVDGVDVREKFRMRYYNKDTEHIHLEKKSKKNNLCHKEGVWISGAECTRILDGDTQWLKDEYSRPLLQELYGKMVVQQLRPKTVSAYERMPYVYPAGNVRVTLDSEMRTGIHNKDFLEADRVPTAYSGGEKSYLLEVKYDSFLPEHIRAMIQLGGRNLSAYSKYAQSRSFG